MTNRQRINREWMAWRSKNTPGILVQAIQAGMAIVFIAFPSFERFMRRGFCCPDKTEAAK